MTTDEKVAEIKRLYYSAKPSTIHGDLARAIDLLKTFEHEEARERVAVYMEGLTQLRSEFRAHGRSGRSGG